MTAIYGPGGLAVVLVTGQDGESIHDEIQAAVDELAGRRGAVMLPAGEFVCGGNVNVKRATLIGQGVPGVSGGGGTTLTFSGTYGISSSIEDNYGFELRDLYVKGSGGTTPTENGQTLVDMAGQNYPRLSNVRIGFAETGLRIAKGSTVESHYGAFYNVSIDKCFVGCRFVTATSGDVNSHQFYGGRWWSNATACLIPDGINNIVFHGVHFEAFTTAGIDSTGDQVSTFGCRFEASSSMVPCLRLRANAGAHFVFGDHFSTGADIDDDSTSGESVFGLSWVEAKPTLLGRPHVKATGGSIRRLVFADDGSVTTEAI